ncbi:MAG: ribonuclease R [Pseudomonadota bacterium]
MPKKQLPPKKKKARAAKRAAAKVPSREQVLKFLAENPQRTSKREISRAFGIKGSDKIHLKALLRDLVDEGLIEKRGKRLAEPGTLPPVTVVDVMTRDRDGGLLGVPATWNEAELGKPPIVEISQHVRAKGQTVGVGNRVLARLNRIGHSSRYTGKIIKVIPKSENETLGVVRIRENSIRLEPAARKQSELDIPSDMVGDAKDGDLVTVETIRGTKYGLKKARVTSVIGSYKTEKAVSLIAIHANEIPHIFPEAVIAEAQNTIPVSQGNREDWRDIPLITIDPADAKDHDDAIAAEADPDVTGGHIVRVAIADVSAYVMPGSAMDREALLRGNSVYFPDRVVPMLPEKISNDLCSLREGEDRPALAVEMRFDADGRKTAHSFHRILMRNHANLAYQRAQAAIDGQPDTKTEPILKTILEPLWAAYRCMQKGRNKRQPLELDLPERKILLNEDGTVRQVVVPERLDAHKLVEECMIQANVCAAETLERNRQKLIYRVHDVPSLDKIERLREFLGTLDISLARPGNLKAQHFNQILARVTDTEHDELVSQVILRSQSQAEYTPENLGHFGLQLSRYAHFTSPIRRYADLTVHRALVGALGIGKGGITPAEEAVLDETAVSISMTERRAMQAERETIDRLIAGFLAEQVGSQFSGRINGVTKAGLFVTLEDTGADGFIPISMLGDDYFVFDETTHSVTGEATGEQYQMGQQVEVKLVEAAPVAGALRFEMISSGTISKSIPRSRNTNKRGSSRRGPGSRRGPARHRKR